MTIVQLETVIASCTRLTLQYARLGSGYSAVLYKLRCEADNPEHNPSAVYEARMTGIWRNARLGVR